MESYIKEALEIVKAQASVRIMTEEELTSMVKKLAAGIKAITDGVAAPCESSSETCADAKKSIKEKSVTCMECGKSFKVLTTRHLAHHGLTPDEYRAKHGIAKGAALCCKSLARERRAKMKDMKLWEKRKAKAVA